MAAMQGVREAIQKRMTAAANEIFGVFVQTMVQYEEEIERQRILLDAVLNPKVKLYRTESEHTEEQEEVEEQQEALPDPLVCNQENTSTVDQEVSRSPQVKKEPEEVWTCDFKEQLEQEQYMDGYRLTFSDKEDEVNDRTPNPDESPSAAKEELEDILVEEFNSSDLPLETHAAHSSFKYLMSQPSSRQRTGERFSDTSSCEAHKTIPIAGRNSLTACGSDFLKNVSLKRPEENRTGLLPFSSHMCGKPSTSKLTIPKNFLINEKPHSCGICGKSYKKKSHLVVHYRVHTGERPYSCNVCGKFFRCKKNLNVHYKIHTGEKPYSCDTCGKRFITNYKLNRHKRTHTMEKPHPCNICGTTFKYMQTLKMHYRIHTDNA